jgi:hypothetical protein
MRLRTPLAALAAVAVLLVGLGLGAPGASAHYLPQANDRFAYTETVVLTNGQGNYLGYTEATYTNGSITVTSVHDNGTENASYQSSWHYVNNSGGNSLGSEKGNFTFSADTFRYVKGTDNQTGYSNPFVWFYMNDSLASGGSFYVLNTPFQVVSTNVSYPIATSSTGYVRTIFTEGNGSFQDVVFGAFNATYNWKAYYDPATGYIVGYVYTEQDTDGSGDAFTLTDTLAVTSTSYALTPATAPPPPPASSGSSSDGTTVAIVVVVVIVVLLLIVVIVAARRRSRLARHSVRGSVAYDPARPMPPPAAPAAPLNFGPVAQPSVQQVVLKETVKVNCRYCGTLIDTTATVCPNCGAPRT